MARYNGPKTKISRIFGEPILGNGKWLGKNSNPPGQHGAQRKRKTLGEYALQLREKQKAKYTYGVLEKQFRKTFEEAARRKGVTGENLIKLLEARLDNTVFRMGIAPSRPAARQLVSHKHIEVNGEVVNIPSFQLKAGDVVTIKEGSKERTSITSVVRAKNPKYNWLDWSETELKGTFITYPERESVPENIKEQLIVELYSKISRELLAMSYGFFTHSPKLFVQSFILNH
jgi:small subunit ribosomal protein S4